MVWGSPPLGFRQTPNAPNSPNFVRPVAPVQKEAIPLSHPQSFSGQTWCVTGSFEHFKPRELAIEEIKRRGGRITSGVTSKTTHLLAGSAAGSKLQKARELDVQIVEEARFLKMIS